MNTHSQNQPNAPAVVVKSHFNVLINDDGEYHRTVGSLWQCSSHAPDVLRVTFVDPPDPQVVWYFPKLAVMHGLTEISLTPDAIFYPLETRPRIGLNLRGEQHDGVPSETTMLIPMRPLTNFLRCTSRVARGARWRGKLSRIIQHLPPDALNDQAPYR